MAMLYFKDQITAVGEHYDQPIVLLEDAVLAGLARLYLTPDRP